MTRHQIDGKQCAKLCLGLTGSTSVNAKVPLSTVRLHSPAFGGTPRRTPETYTAGRDVDLGAGHGWRDRDFPRRAATSWSSLGGGDAGSSHGGRCGERDARHRQNGCDLTTLLVCTQTEGCGSKREQWADLNAPQETLDPNKPDGWDDRQRSRRRSSDSC